MIRRLRAAGLERSWFKVRTEHRIPRIEMPSYPIDPAMDCVAGLLAQGFRVEIFYLGIWPVEIVIREKWMLEYHPRSLYIRQIAECELPYVRC